MKFFNAKFEPTNINPLTDNSQFQLTGNILDNTGMFSALDANVGDIIYLDGAFLGDLLLRYKVIEIVNASGLELTAKVQWDMSGEVVTPLPSMDGIIGKSIENSKLSMITSVTTNAASELLVSVARSYEQSLMVNETNGNINKVESKIKIPTLGYSTL